MFFIKHLKISFKDPIRYFLSSHNLYFSQQFKQFHFNNLLEDFQRILQAFSLREAYSRLRALHSLKMLSAALTYFCCALLLFYFTFRIFIDFVLFAFVVFSLHFYNT